jgi:hypothetical protein
MKLREINPENNREVKRFVQFPFDLYRNEPNWVPPLRKEIEFALDQQNHPFYKHSEAAFFIVEEAGQVRGRIAALDNERFREHTGQKTGFFYFFESENNVDISRLLFNAAFDWTRARGLEKVIGPKGLAQGDGLGLLVEGFEYMPAVGIPYNPVYYIDLVVDAGFEKEVDYLSGHLSTDYQLPGKFKRLVGKVKKRRGFWVKEFESKDELRSWIPKIREVYNAAFIDVPTFVPITEEEVNLIADRILSVADPKLIKLIFQGEELVGFLFSYHNISEGLKKARGRLFPFGWYHIMRAFKRSKWVDINGMGLLPGCQGLGATAVMYDELEKSIKSYPFENADIVQIAETNLKSFTEAEHLGVNWHKRHRIYHKQI